MFVFMHPVPRQYRIPNAKDIYVELVSPLARVLGRLLSCTSKLYENKTAVEGHAFGYHLVVTPC